jgi:hypothetical protein
MTSQVMDSGFYFSDTGAIAISAEVSEGRNIIDEKARFQRVFRRVVVLLSFGMVKEPQNRGAASRIRPHDLLTRTE